MDAVDPVASGPSAEPADPDLERVGRLLDTLDGQPIAEHAAVFGEVHDRLVDALGRTDQADQGPRRAGPADPGTPRPASS